VSLRAKVERQGLFTGPILDDFAATVEKSEVCDLCGTFSVRNIDPELIETFFGIQVYADWLCVFASFDWKL
jgi:hypothetical protein